MQIYYTDTAKQNLNGLEHEDRKRIVNKVRHYAAHPDPLEFAEPLTGYPLFRFRIGNHRVIFQIIRSVLFVITIDRRDKAYRDL